MAHQEYRSPEPSVKFEDLLAMSHREDHLMPRCVRLEMSLHRQMSASGLHAFYQMQAAAGLTSVSETYGPMKRHCNPVFLGGLHL